SGCSRPGVTTSGQRASAGSCVPFCPEMAKTACSCTLIVTTTHISGPPAVVSRDTSVPGPCRSLNYPPSSLPCQRHFEDYLIHLLTAICTALVCHRSGYQLCERSVRKMHYLRCYKSCRRMWQSACAMWRQVDWSCPQYQLVYSARRLNTLTRRATSS